MPNQDLLEHSSSQCFAFSLLLKLPLPALKNKQKISFYAWVFSKGNLVNMNCISTSFSQDLDLRLISNWTSVYKKNSKMLHYLCLPNTSMHGRGATIRWTYATAEGGKTEEGQSTGFIRSVLTQGAWSRPFKLPTRGNSKIATPAKISRLLNSDRTVRPKKG